MGHTFTWLSKLWIIVHEMIWDGYLFKHDLWPADAVYRKLLAWSEKLPDTAKRTEDCPHHVLIAQYASISCGRQYLDKLTE